MIIYKRKKMKKRVIIIFLLFSLLLLCAGAVPLTPYRQIGDSWFRVVYPEGYRDVAEKILAYANDIREKHEAWLGEFADERVTIYLSNETNNFATSYSSPTGQLHVFMNFNAIWAANPDEVGNFIYNLLAHELTHTTHLSKTGTLGKAARKIFGQRYAIGATAPPPLPCGFSKD
jgi:hypothetical protein